MIAPRPALNKGLRRLAAFDRALSLPNVEPETRARLEKLRRVEAATVKMLRRASQKPPQPPSSQPPRPSQSSSPPRNPPESQQPPEQNPEPDSAA